MTPVIIPKESKAEYPNRSGDESLNLLPGDVCIENYFNASVLLTHENNNSSPTIYISTLRSNDRPDIKEDAATIILSSGKNIDSNNFHSNTTNKPNTGITKPVAVNADDIRTNSKKNTFMSSGKEFGISANEAIKIHSNRDIELYCNGNIKIKCNGTITLDGAQIKLGDNAIEGLIKSSFLSLYNTHFHGNGNQGAPTTPPVSPASPSNITQIVKAK